MAETGQKSNETMSSTENKGAFNVVGSAVDTSFSTIFKYRAIKQLHLLLY